MNRILLTITAFLLFSTSYSQPLTPNDSVSTNAGNTHMVFYNFTTGYKSVSSNTDWHFAVTVRPTQFPDYPLGGTTVRINEAFGVNVYQIPGFNETSTDSIVDTTNYHTWLKLHDSDTLLDLGAFNRDYSMPFNYGWGNYTPDAQHSVVGKKVFLVELPNGAVKKVFIEKLVYDTAWIISYKNIDNTDSAGFIVNKHQYQGKNFVYLNLIDHTVLDKEPLAADWDVQFLKYANETPDSVYPVTGVWLNGGLAAAKVEQVYVDGNNYYQVTLSNMLALIGYDWQVYDTASHTYSVRDSLIYVVRAKNDSAYAMVFTGFGGSATGVISFYKEYIPPAATSIYNTQSTQLSFEAFPNPANSYLNVRLSSSTPATLRVVDLSGRVVLESAATGQLSQLNTSGLDSGIYLLGVTTNGQTSFRKFVIAR